MKSEIQCVISAITFLIYSSNHFRHKAGYRSVSSLLQVFKCEMANFKFVSCRVYIANFLRNVFVFLTASITVYLSNSIKVLKLLSQIFFVDPCRREKFVLCHVSQYEKFPCSKTTMPGFE